MLEAAICMVSLVFRFTKKQLKTNRISKMEQEKRRRGGYAARVSPRPRNKTDATAAMHPSRRVAATEVAPGVARAEVTRSGGETALMDRWLSAPRQPQRGVLSSTSATLLTPPSVLNGRAEAALEELVHSESRVPSRIVASRRTLQTPPSPERLLLASSVEIGAPREVTVDGMEIVRIACIERDDRLHIERMLAEREEAHERSQWEAIEGHEWRLLMLHEAARYRFIATKEDHNDTVAAIRNGSCADWTTEVKESIIQGTRRAQSDLEATRKTMEELVRHEHELAASFEAERNRIRDERRDILSYLATVEAQTRGVQHAREEELIVSAFPVDVPLERQPPESVEPVPKLSQPASEGQQTQEAAPQHSASAVPDSASIWHPPESPPRTSGAPYLSDIVNGRDKFMAALVHDVSDVIIRSNTAMAKVAELLEGL